MGEGVAFCPATGARTPCPRRSLLVRKLPAREISMGKLHCGGHGFIKDPYVMVFFEDDTTPRSITAHFVSLGSSTLTT